MTLGPLQEPTREFDVSKLLEQQSVEDRTVKMREGVAEPWELAAARQGWVRIGNRFINLSQITSIELERGVALVYQPGNNYRLEGREAEALERALVQAPTPPP